MELYEYAKLYCVYKAVCVAYPLVNMVFEVWIVCELCSCIHWGWNSTFWRHCVSV